MQENRQNINTKLPLTLIEQKALKSDQNRVGEWHEIGRRVMSYQSSSKSVINEAYREYKKHLIRRIHHEIKLRIPKNHYYVLLVDYWTCKGGPDADYNITKTINDIISCYADNPNDSYCKSASAWKNIVNTREEERAEFRVELVTRDSVRYVEYNQPVNKRKRTTLIKNNIKLN